MVSQSFTFALAAKAISYFLLSVIFHEQLSAQANLEKDPEWYRLIYETERSDTCKAVCIQPSSDRSTLEYLN